jgi:hypothetical protein
MARVAGNRYRVGTRLHHSRDKAGSSCATKTLVIFAFLLVCWVSLLGYYWFTHPHVGGVDIGTTIQEEIDLTKKLIEDAINVGLDHPSNGNTMSVPVSIAVDVPPFTGRKKIAYAITVTKDGAFLDGALVLGYGVMKLHHRNGQTGNAYWDKFRLHELGSRLKKQAGSAQGFMPELSEYDADLVAFVTPAITHAKHILGESM